MRFKIDWASLIVGSKFTVFALFYFVFEGNFPSASPRGGLYLEGRFNGGFFCVTSLGGLYLWGLIHERAYFRNFPVSPTSFSGLSPCRYYGTQKFKKSNKLNF